MRPVELLTGILRRSDQDDRAQTGKLASEQSCFQTQEPASSEQLASSAQNLVQRFLEMRRALGEFPPNLLDVFLIALLDLFAKKLTQSAIAKPVLALLRVIRDQIGDQGARQTALRHAQDAYAETRTARWAWRAVLESKLEIADWDGARDLVKSALDRKVVPPVIAERARAALLAASAAQLEHAADAKARGQALDQAVEAAKLQPGFAPGVVMAARLLSEAGKLGRAAATLETAWRVAPHPALWLAYRDLRTDETPRERAQRLAQLAAVNPTHRESLILGVEQALIRGDSAGAGEAAKALEGEPVSARIAGLMARAAFAAGAVDEARVWLARGASAPHEPDWSDLDPEGRAFAYQASDWARLAITYAETGDLIHPRHERQEHSLRELPDLPLAYAETRSMLIEPVPYPLDEGYADDTEPDGVRAVN